MTTSNTTTTMSIEDVQALHKSGNTVAVVGLYNKGNFLSDVEVVWFTDPPLEFPFSLDQNINLCNRVSFARVRSKFRLPMFDQLPVLSKIGAVARCNVVVGYTELRPRDDKHLNVWKTEEFLRLQQWAGIAHMPQDKSLKIYLLPTSIITHEIGITKTNYPHMLHALFVKKVTPGEDFRCQLVKQPRYPILPVDTNRPLVLYSRTDSVGSEFENVESGSRTPLSDSRESSPAVLLQQNKKKRYKTSKNLVPSQPAPVASVVPAAPMEVGDEEKSPPPPPVQRRKRRVAAEKARQVIKKLKIDDTQGERDDEYSPCTGGTSTQPEESSSPVTLQQPFAADHVLLDGHIEAVIASPEEKYVLDPFVTVEEVTLEEIMVEEVMAEEVMSERLMTEEVIVKQVMVDGADSEQVELDTQVSMGSDLPLTEDSVLDSLVLEPFQAQLPRRVSLEEYMVKRRKRSEAAELAKDAPEQEQQQTIEISEDVVVESSEAAPLLDQEEDEDLLVIQVDVAQENRKRQLLADAEAALHSVTKSIDKERTVQDSPVKDIEQIKTSLQTEGISVHTAPSLEVSSAHLLSATDKQVSSSGITSVAESSSQAKVSVSSSTPTVAAVAAAVSKVPKLKVLAQQRLTRYLAEGADSSPKKQVSDQHSAQSEKAGSNTLENEAQSNAGAESDGSRASNKAREMERVLSRSFPTPPPMPLQASIYQPYRHPFPPPILEHPRPPPFISTHPLLPFQRPPFHQPEPPPIHQFPLPPQMFPPVHSPFSSLGGQTWGQGSQSRALSTELQEMSSIFEAQKELQNSLRAQRGRSPHRSRYSRSRSRSRSSSRYSSRSPSRSPSRHRRSSRSRHRYTRSISPYHEPIRLRNNSTQTNFSTDSVGIQASFQQISSFTQTYEPRVRNKRVQTYPDTRNKSLQVMLDNPQPCSSQSTQTTLPRQVDTAMQTDLPSEVSRVLSSLLSRISSLGNTNLEKVIRKEAEWLEGRLDRHRPAVFQGGDALELISDEEDSKLAYSPLSGCSNISEGNWSDLHSEHSPVESKATHIRSRHTDQTHYRRHSHSRDDFSPVTNQQQHEPPRVVDYSGFKSPSPVPRVSTLRRSESQTALVSCNEPSQGFRPSWLPVTESIPESTSSKTATTDDPPSTACQSISPIDHSRFERSHFSSEPDEVPVSPTDDARMTRSCSVPLKSAPALPPSAASKSVPVTPDTPVLRRLTTRHGLTDLPTAKPLTAEEILAKVKFRKAVEKIQKAVQANEERLKEERLKEERLKEERLKAERLKEEWLKEEQLKKEQRLKEVMLKEQAAKEEGKKQQEQRKASRVNMQELQERLRHHLQVVRAERSGSSSSSSSPTLATAQGLLSVYTPLTPSPVSSCSVSFSPPLPPEVDEPKPPPPPPPPPPDEVELSLTEYQQLLPLAAIEKDVAMEEKCQSPSSETERQGLPPAEMGIECHKPPPAKAVMEEQVFHEFPPVNMETEERCDPPSVEDISPPSEMEGDEHSDPSIPTEEDFYDLPSADREHELSPAEERSPADGESQLTKMEEKESNNPPLAEEKILCEVPPTEVVEKEDVCRLPPPPEVEEEQLLDSPLPEMEKEPCLPSAVELSLEKCDSPAAELEIEELSPPEVEVDSSCHDALTERDDRQESPLKMADDSVHELLLTEEVRYGQSQATEVTLSLSVVEEHKPAEMEEDEGDLPLVEELSPVEECYELPPDGSQVEQQYHDPPLGEEHCASTPPGKIEEESESHEELEQHSNLPLEEQPLDEMQEDSHEPADSPPLEEQLLDEIKEESHEPAEEHSDLTLSEENALLQEEIFEPAEEHGDPLLEERLLVEMQEESHEPAEEHSNPPLNEDALLQEEILEPAIEHSDPPFEEGSLNEMQEDSHEAVAEFNSPPAVVQEERDDLPPPAVVEMEEDCVPPSAVVEEEEDNVPSPAVVEMEEDSVPSPAIVEGEEDSVPSPAIVEGEEDSVPPSAVVKEEEDSVPPSAIVEEDSVPSPAIVEEDSVPPPAVVKEDCVPPSAVVEEDSVPSPVVVEEEEDSVPPPAEDSVPPSAVVEEDSVPPPAEDSVPPSAVVEEDSVPPSAVVEEDSVPSPAVAEEDSVLPLAVVEEDNSFPLAEIAGEEYQELSLAETKLAPTEMDIEHSPVEEKLLLTRLDVPHSELPQIEDQLSDLPSAETEVTECIDSPSPKVSESEYCNLSPAEGELEQYNDSTMMELVESPLVQGQPCESPEVDEEPLELRQVEKKPCELPLVDKEAPCELPQAEEQLNGLPSAKMEVDETEVEQHNDLIPLVELLDTPPVQSEPCELPKVEEELHIREMHTVEEPHELPLVEEEPCEMPLVEEEPCELPLVEEEPHELPLVEEEPCELPLVEEEPRELPLVEEEPCELPLVEEEPRELPLVEEEPRELPLVEEEPCELPLVEEESRELPLVEEEPREMPNVEEKTRELPLMEEESRELPLVEEEPRELPLMEEEPRELPLMEEEPCELPLVEEEPREMPLVEEEPCELPVVECELPLMEEEPCELPVVEEEPRELPLVEEEPREMVVEEPREMPNVEEKTRELPLVEEEPCELPLMEEEPRELPLVEEEPPLVEEEPCELPLMEEEPRELPLVEEEPCELSLMEEEPCELPLVEEEPCELPLVEKEPRELPLVEKEPRELPLVEEEPRELPLVEEEPCELPLMEEEPCELPLVEEEPCELPLVEEEPCELPLIEEKRVLPTVEEEPQELPTVEEPCEMSLVEKPHEFPEVEEEPREMPNVEEKTRELPLVEEPCEMPTVEEPHELPLMEEPCELPLVEEEPCELPLVEEEPHELPLVEEEPCELPLMEEEPRELPLVEEEPSELPLVEEEPRELPLMEEEPRELPLVEEEPSELPLVEEEPRELPLMEEEPRELPLVEEEPSELPLVEEEPRELPLMEEEPRELPLMEEEPSELPLVEEEPSELPPVEEPRELPLVEEEPSELPLVEEEPRELPPVEEEPRELPLVEEKCELSTVQEEPCEMSLMEEEPHELPLVEEPRELPLMEDKPCELPLMEEEPREMPLMEDKPCELPPVEEEPREMPTVEEPREMPLVEEEPREMPLVEEEPCEMSLMEEEPHELPLVEEPRELPLMEDKPCELPLMEEEPREMPLMEDKPCELPPVEEEPREMPTVEEPRELPLVEEEPREMPLVEEEPCEMPTVEEPREMPLVEEEPFEMPLVKEEPCEMPTVEEPREMPLVEEEPREMPLVEEEPREMPTVVEEPREMPTVEEEPREMPLVEEEPREMPLVEEEPREMPLVEEEPREMPLVEEEPREMPLVEEEPREMPTVVEEPREMPTVEEEPREMPTVEEEPREMPTVVEEPREMPTVEEEPREMPTVEEEPREMPTVEEEPREIPTVKEPREMPTVEEIYEPPSYEVEYLDTTTLGQRNWPAVDNPMTFTVQDGMVLMFDSALSLQSIADTRKEKSSCFVVELESGDDGVQVSTTPEPVITTRRLSKRLRTRSDERSEEEMEKQKSKEVKKGKNDDSTKENDANMEEENTVRTYWTRSKKRRQEKGTQQKNKSRKKSSSGRKNENTAENANTEQEMEEEEDDTENKKTEEDVDIEETAEEQEKLDQATEMQVDNVAEPPVSSDLLTTSSSEGEMSVPAIPQSFPAIAEQQQVTVLAACITASSFIAAGNPLSLETVVDQPTPPSADSSLLPEQIVGSPSSLQPPSLVEEDMAAEPREECVGDSKEGVEEKEMIVEESEETKVNEEGDVVMEDEPCEGLPVTMETEAKEQELLVSFSRHRIQLVEKLDRTQLETNTAATGNQSSESGSSLSEQNQPTEPSPVKRSDTVDSVLTTEEEMQTLSGCDEDLQCSESESKPSGEDMIKDSSPTAGESSFSSTESIEKGRWIHDSLSSRSGTNVTVLSFSAFSLSPSPTLSHSLEVLPISESRPLLSPSQLVVKIPLNSIPEADESNEPSMAVLSSSASSLSPSSTLSRSLPTSEESRPLFSPSQLVVKIPLNSVVEANEPSEMVLGTLNTQTSPPCSPPSVPLSQSHDTPSHEPLSHDTPSHEPFSHDTPSHEPLSYEPLSHEPLPLSHEDPLTPSREPLSHEPLSPSHEDPFSPSHEDLLSLPSPLSLTPSPSSPVISIHSSSDSESTPGEEVSIDKPVQLSSLEVASPTDSCKLLSSSDNSLVVVGGANPVPIEISSSTSSLPASTDSCQLLSSPLVVGGANPVPLPTIEISSSSSSSPISSPSLPCLQSPPKFFDEESEKDDDSSSVITCASTVGNLELQLSLSASNTDTSANFDLDSDLDMEVDDQVFKKELSSDGFALDNPIATSFLPDVSEQARNEEEDDGMYCDAVFSSPHCSAQQDEVVCPMVLSPHHYQADNEMSSPVTPNLFSSFATPIEEPCDKEECAAAICGEKPPLPVDSEATDTATEDSETTLSDMSTHEEMAATDVKQDVTLTSNSDSLLSSHNSLATAPVERICSPPPGSTTAHDTATGDFMCDEQLVCSPPVSPTSPGSATALVTAPIEHMCDEQLVHSPPVSPAAHDSLATAEHMSDEQLMPSPPASPVSTTAHDSLATAPVEHASVEHLVSSPVSPAAHDILAAAAPVEHMSVEQPVHSPPASPGITAVTQDDSGSTSSDHGYNPTPAALSSAVDILNSPLTTQEDSTSVDPSCPQTIPSSVMDGCLSSPVEQDDIASTHTDIESISLSPHISADALTSPSPTQDNLVPLSQNASCSTTNVLSLSPAVQEPTPAMNDTTHSLAATSVNILNDHNYLSRAMAQPVGIPNDHNYLSQVMAPPVCISSDRNYQVVSTTEDSVSISSVAEEDDCTTPNPLPKTSPSIGFSLFLLGSRLCDDDCLSASPQTISSIASDFLASPTSQDELGITTSDCEILDSPPPPPPIHENTQSDDELLAYSPLFSLAVPASPALDVCPSPGTQEHLTISSPIVAASPGAPDDEDAVSPPSALSCSIPAPSSQERSELSSEEMDIDRSTLTEPEIETQHLAESVHISTAANSRDPPVEEMEQDYELNMKDNPSLKRLKLSAVDKSDPLIFDDSELLDSDETGNEVCSTSGSLPVVSSAKEIDAVDVLDNCEFDLLHQNEDVSSRQENASQSSQDDVFELDGLLQKELGVSSTSTKQEDAVSQTSHDDVFKLDGLLKEELGMSSQIGQDDVFELDSLLQEEMGVPLVDMDKEEEEQLDSGRIDVVISPTSTCREGSPSSKNTDYFETMTSLELERTDDEELMEAAASSSHDTEVAVLGSPLNTNQPTAPCDAMETETSVEDRRDSTPCTNQQRFSEGQISAEPISIASSLDEPQDNKIPISMSKECSGLSKTKSKDVLPTNSKQKESMDVNLAKQFDGAAVSRSVASTTPVKRVQSVKVRGEITKAVKKKVVKKSPPPPLQSVKKSPPPLLQSVKKSPPPPLQSVKKSPPPLLQSVKKSPPPLLQSVKKSPPPPLQSCPSSESVSSASLSPCSELTLSPSAVSRKSPSLLPTLSSQEPRSPIYDHYDGRPPHHHSRREALLHLPPYRYHPYMSTNRFSNRYQSRPSGPRPPPPPWVPPHPHQFPYPPDHFDDHSYYDNHNYHSFSHNLPPPPLHPPPRSWRPPPPPPSLRPNHHYPPPPPQNHHWNRHR